MPPSQFSVGCVFPFDMAAPSHRRRLTNNCFLWLCYCPATLEGALPDLLNETDFLWEDISAQVALGTDLFISLRVWAVILCEMRERLQDWNDGVWMRTLSFGHDVLPSFSSDRIRCFHFVIKPRLEQFESVTSWVLAGWPQRSRLETSVTLEYTIILWYVSSPNTFIR